MNKRIKIDNKSSNYDSVLLVSSLFIVHNIVDSFEKKEIDLVT